MFHSAKPKFWKVGTDVRTDDMCKNIDYYRSWLWVGLVDQQHMENVPYFSLSCWPETK